MFKPITREKTRLRLALCGPPGSGKTYTALRFAFALGKRVAVIDTEHHSAAKYQGTEVDDRVWNWDGVDLVHYSPMAYKTAVDAAGRGGYDVLIIDSLSHAWQGTGGALDQVDKAQATNKFTAWRDVTPQHNAMIESILSSPCHVIATMRSRMDYVLEPNEKGKMVPRRVGLKPVQREGVEYEFDIVADLDAMTLRVTKSRCPFIVDMVDYQPGPECIIPVQDWLATGQAPKDKTPGEPPEETTETSDVPLSPDEQEIIYIRESWSRMQLPIAKLREVMEKHNAEKISELPRNVRSQLVARLQSLETKRQAKEAF